MRVLFVSATFPNPFDPQKGTFNREMIRQLSADHEIRVVCPIGWTEPDRGQRSAVRQLGSTPDVTYVRYYYLPRVLHAFRDVFLWWSIRGPLRTITRGWRPDLILAYWTHPDGFAARRLASELEVPFVQIVGGSDVLVIASGFRRQKIARMLRGADAVISIGKHLSAQVIALGVPADRVVDVYRPVPEGTFSPGEQQRARRDLQLQPDVPTVLWVGRFVPVKGLEILIEAMSQLARGMRDVRLCLVGTGPEVRRVQELVRRHGLERIVRFVGPVPYERLGPWYRAADVTVLASQSEGVPNVLLESMACGTPFVATRVGGVPEIADPAVDRLVPPGDPSALADALSATLSRRAEVVRSGRIMSTAEVLRGQFNGVFERVTRQRCKLEPALLQRSAREQL